MKTKALLFLNTHKAVLISFGSGFILAVLIFVLMPTNTKTAEKIIKKERQETEKLVKDFVPVNVLKKQNDSLFLALEKEKIKTLKELKVIKKQLNENINNVPNSTSDFRQKYITEWAERQTRNIDMAE
jgi:ABC-type bacteriocin/lantibiotic exporter with double-glycine peptidase domain